jgi:dihydroneopterin aldolase
MSSFLTDPRLASCRRIFLRNLQVQANIGVHTYERGVTQPLLLNIDVFVPLASSTPHEDRLEEVFDYDVVMQLVRERLGRGHINLQETLVDDLAADLLRRPQVVAVRVASEKTGIYAGVGGVGVEILRFAADVA